MGGSRNTWSVIPGVPESLGAIPGHRPVEGIDRFKLLGPSSLPDAFPHCAVHHVTGKFHPDPGWQYTHPHAHDFDEVNIILSETGGLRFRYELDGVTEVVDSPCTVFLPAGVSHRMEAAGGTGIFLCIHLPGKERK